MTSRLPQFAGLSLAEKLQLLEDLWNDIAESPEKLPFPEWQREELDRRRKDFEAKPDSCVSWEEVKRRMHDSRSRNA